MLSNEGQLNISGLGAADVSVLLGEARNVVVHTTGAYREDFLVSLVSQFGPDRLMYAAATRGSARNMSCAALQWADGLTAQAIDRVVWATAAAVFGLPTGRP